MSSRFWTMCLLCSAIAAAGWLCRDRIARACGWNPSDEEVHTIYSQRIVGPTPLAPYLFMSDWNDNLIKDLTIPPEGGPDNLADWQAELGGDVRRQDLAELIYKWSINEVLDLTARLSDARLPLSEGLKHNSAAQRLMATSDRATLAYLAYAKRCEWFTVERADGWEPPVKEAEAMTDLIAAGQQQYAVCPKASLRRRYAYQMIRLAHFSGQFDLALRLYERSFAGVPRTTFVALKAYALAGGAHYREGNRAQAKYIFSRVFDELPSEREMATVSFAWADDNSTPNAGLALCRSAHERATFWFMEAYNSAYQDYLPYLRQIYQTESNSEYLTLLLARYLALVQEAMLPWKSSYVDEYRLERARDAASHRRDAQQFMARCIAHGRLRRPDLWTFALGYLEYLDGNTSMAQIHFEQTKALAASNPLMLDQVRAMDILLRIQQAPRIDPTFEAQLVEDFRWLRRYTGPLKAKDVASYAMLQLAKRYDEQNDPARSILCRSASYSGYDLRDHPADEPLDPLVAFKRKPAKTAFETMLDTGFVSLSRLHELKGTVRLSQYELAGAIRDFEQTDSSDLAWFRADPFSSRIRDCHDCDEAVSDTFYTKLSFARRMVALEQQAEQAANPAVEFELGNASYNMSYYGNAWRMTSYTRNHVLFSYESEIHRLTSGFYDCSQALWHYQRAMATAGADRELAAKACFMAAKCEQNAFYNTGQLKDRDLLNRNYRTYFRKMQDRYATTAYYRQVIAECGSFRRFVTR